MSTSTTTLTEVWPGRTPLRSALRSSAIEISGRRDVVRALPGAMQLSPIADLVAHVRGAAPTGNGVTDQSGDR